MTSPERALQPSSDIQEPVTSGEVKPKDQLAQRSRYLLCGRVLVYGSLLLGAVLSMMARPVGEGAGMIVFLSFYAAFVTGCGCYARAKGYHWAVGLLGVFNCLGLVVLACLPDKFSARKEDSGGEAAC